MVPISASIKRNCRKADIHACLGLGKTTEKIIWFVLVLRFLKIKVSERRVLKSSVLFFLFHQKTVALDILLDKQSKIS